MVSDGTTETSMSPPQPTADQQPSKPNLALKQSSRPGSVTTSGTLGCGPIILDFHALAHGRPEVFISLDGEAYRLRLTRNNKLILTK